LTVNDDVQLSTEEAERDLRADTDAWHNNNRCESGIEPRFFGSAVRNLVIIPDELFVPQMNFTPWN